MYGQGCGWLNGGHGTKRVCSRCANSSTKRARWNKSLPELIRHKGWTIASDQDNIYPVTCYMDAVADPAVRGAQRPCQISKRQCPATLTSQNLQLLFLSGNVQGNHLLYFWMFSFKGKFILVNPWNILAVRDFLWQASRAVPIATWDFFEKGSTTILQELWRIVQL